MMNRNASIIIFRRFVRSRRLYIVPKILILFAFIQLSSETQRRPDDAATYLTGGFKERPAEQIRLKHDYIGPADVKSNIRPIIRHVSTKESELEHTLRMKRLEVEHWNQEFWASHNKRFVDVSKL